MTTGTADDGTADDAWLRDLLLHGDWLSGSRDAEAMAAVLAVRPGGRQQRRGDARVARRAR